ncbi:MAG: hypothetical protein ACLP9L_15730 [Thermoguttaceae bacterium]
MPNPTDPALPDAPRGSLIYMIGNRTYELPPDDDGSVLTCQSNADSGAGLAWLPAAAIGNLTASYVTQTVDATLANSQALDALGTGILKSTTGTGVLSIAGGADLPIMVASGTGHHGGAVPDPGASAASTHFLREDATWAIPPGTYTLPSALTGASLVLSGSIAVNGVATPPAKAAFPGTASSLDAAVINAITAILVALGFCAAS